MMDGFYGAMSWGGWIPMALLMVTFWGLVVYAIVALFRGSSAGPSPDLDRRADPLGILDERFARGEIQLDEYWARKEALADADLARRR